MKDSETRTPFLLKVNKMLTFIDNGVDRMGIWYKVIFTYFWSIVAVSCSLQVLISATASASRSPFLLENQYIGSIISMGLFIILLVYKPKAATVIEVVLCSLFTVTGICQKLNLLWFSLDAGIYLYLGMVFCTGLLAGQIFWLIVNILKRYRRRHMKKRLVSPMEEEVFNTQNSQWVTTIYVRENKGKSRRSNLDQDGFITTSSNIKTGGNGMPDSTGFVIDKDTDKK
ncbi:MAG: hypothetical protein ACI4HL_01970 [Ruminococcus sp.]